MTINKKSALKENLIKQYNQTIANLQRIEGALAVLNQLEEEAEPAAEEETSEEE